MRIASIICMLFFMLTACKKEAGLGGKNTINGTVLYKNGTSAQNDPASSATISIAYGSGGSVSAYDQVILTNAEGKFSITGFRKGNYFIKAGYTDQNGFVYSTPGFAIEINNKKSTVEVNMVLE